MTDTKSVPANIQYEALHQEDRRHLIAISNPWLQSLQTTSLEDWINNEQTTKPYLLIDMEKFQSLLAYLQAKTDARLELLDMLASMRPDVSRNSFDHWMRLGSKHHPCLHVDLRELVRILDWGKAKWIASPKT